MPLKISRQLLVFGLIGVINTATDFTVYLTLLHFTDSIVIANLCATTTGLIVSFILNSKFTFQTKRLGKARFFGFIGVTLFGLWVLQTAIIYGLTPIVAHLPDGLFNILGMSVGQQLQKAVPKLVATVFTLIWNYLWYSRVIFKRDSVGPAAIQ